MAFETNKDFQEFQAGVTLVRLNKLLASNYLQNPQNIGELYYQSVFTECVIHLNYLFDLFKDIAESISFDDDIPPFNKPKVGRYKDIISLIDFFRNAICHSEQVEKRLHDEKGFYTYSFNIFNDEFAAVQEVVYCKYEDDIAAVLGHHILYIRRHLEKACNLFSDKIFGLPGYSVYAQLL